MTDLHSPREEQAGAPEPFAALEAEMWAGFESREARQRQLLEERELQTARMRAAYEAQLAELRAEIERHELTIAELSETRFQTTVRLQRILSSPPWRLYAALLRLPGFRWLQERRERAYSDALARQRPR